MGVPLLLVGASAGQLLPKAGAWMDAVKAVFGVMLLGVAVWMLGRILPGPVTLGAVGRARLRLGLLPDDAGRPRGAKRRRRACAAGSARSRSSTAC